MAFSASGMNNIGVGPTKLYIYTTTDTITTESVKSTFSTDNCPGISIGDIIFIAHTATTYVLAPVRITAIAATTCTVTEVVALK